MKSILAGLTLSALAFSTAFAAPSSGVRSDIAATKDGTAVHVVRQGAINTQAAPPPTKLLTIFDNFAHRYPKGVYGSFVGRNVTGSQNASNFPEYWLASPFTPSVAHTASEIRVPVQAWAGTNAAIVGLYGDSAGLPGTAIKEWHVENMPSSGCCALVTVRSKVGIPLTAGTQYWIVVRPDPSKGNDQFMAWNYNVTDQVTTSNFAYYCKDTATATCNVQSGAWHPNNYFVALAYGVYGPN